MQIQWINSGNQAFGFTTKFVRGGLRKPRCSTSLNALTPQRDYDLKRKLMRYIRQYKKSPRTVEWKYADPSRHIGTKMSRYRPLGQASFG